MYGQVHELHRLYQTQKRLMRSTDESKRHNGTMSNGNAQKKSRLKIDLEQPLMNINNAAEDAPSEVIDESEIELTLGPSSYSTRRKKSATTPLTSESGGGSGSLSSSSTESSQLVDRRICNSNIAGDLMKGEVSMKLRFQKTNSSRSTVHGDEEELRQENITHQPPWFYNVLTLNMT